MQHDRQLEQRLQRNGPKTLAEELLLQSIRERQEQQALLSEDLQLLRETFAVLAPSAARVHIHSYVDPRDQGIVVHEVEVYDDRGLVIPCQGQDVGNWTEVISSEYLGYILHCMYEADACGDHQFNLR